MRSPETFDAFYASNRDRLLHEAYALTGDIAASRTAVRDAFAVAWHHWRKVALIDDPQAWLRPVAHGRARRRASARPWHRDKGIDPEVQATLDTLANLKGAQRQLLVLTAISPLSMRQIARAVAMTPAEVDAELESAVTAFAEDRDVDPTRIRGLLDDLRGPVASVRWPRAPIVRRAGTARRRTHTAVGAVLAAAAMVVSGSLVATGNDARTTNLQDDRPATQIAILDGDSESPTAEPLDATRLLADDQVTRYAPAATWTETGTTDRLGTDGVVMACQRETLADPDATGALVRTWDATPRKSRKATTQLTQAVERSPDVEAAALAFLTTRGWFGGCIDDRTQLLATQSVRRLGDEATQFRLRRWGKQRSHLLVGVARTGTLVVTTVVESRTRPVPDRIGIQALSAAVNRWCGDADAGPCAGGASGRRTPPLTIGDPSGFLAAVDMPPLAVARGTWEGTEPQPVEVNFASSPCDRTTFKEKGIRRALTRTFLFPDMPRAHRLGLTQTAAIAAKKRRATDFVGSIRNRIRACGQANLGTTVTPLVSRSDKTGEIHAWALEVELSDSQSAAFLMAVVRRGNTVAQMGFTPDGRSTMARADFLALADRALIRLKDLPGHKE
jgi:DNA-directed RNA polymerase specialized sigma24 family protein